MVNSLPRTPQGSKCNPFREAVQQSHPHKIIPELNRLVHNPLTTLPCLYFEVVVLAEWWHREWSLRVTTSVTTESKKVNMSDLDHRYCSSPALTGAALSNLLTSHVSVVRVGGKEGSQEENRVCFYYFFIVLCLFSIVASSGLVGQKAASEPVLLLARKEAPQGCAWCFWRHHLLIKFLPCLQTLLQAFRGLLTACIVAATHRPPISPRKIPFCKPIWRWR